MHSQAVWIHTNFARVHPIRTQALTLRLMEFPLPNTYLEQPL